MLTSHIFNDILAVQKGVNTLNERIKELRKYLGYTQQEFAEKIGTARNNIAGYETGKRSPSEAVISLICKTFNVSDAWLRTGSGEMLVAQTRNDEITDFINKTLQGKPESFKLRLISAFSRLDEADWEILERLAVKLAEGENKPSVSVPAPARSTEMTDEEAHRELDRQLRDEKEQAEKSPASQKSNSSSAKLA